jgi:hypothetical protein
MAPDSNPCDLRLRKKNEIVSRQIAGEMMLIPVMGKIADMKRIFALNPAGEFIWTRLDGGSSLGQISDEMSASFDISREQAFKDAEEFVSELLKEGLIEAVA